MLNNYVLELKEANPRSNVSVVSNIQNGFDYPVFERIYICLTPIREGFLQGCRKIIGLDGCFLKGLMKGQLLVGMGRDGKNQMFPITWSIVDKKTIETLVWFLEHLSSDLQLGDGLGWSIISDMQKGLIHAVRDLLPLIEHRMCARHIYATWGKRHLGKKIQLQFLNVARLTNKVVMHLDRMRGLKDGTSATDDLVEN